MRNMKFAGLAGQFPSILKAGLLSAFAVLATSPSYGPEAKSPLFKYPETAINGMTSAEIMKTEDECRKICSSRAGCAGFDHSDRRSRSRH
jgi:hypothetical protein